jgi:hypothetical protein
LFEHWVVEVLAQVVRREHRALEAELGDDALELVGGLGRLAERDRADGHEAVRVGGDVFRHLIVLDLRDDRAQLVAEAVEIGLRGPRQHVDVDAGGIHVLEAARNVVAAGREVLVDDAGDVKRPKILVLLRNGHRRLGRCLADQGGGFQRQDVGVGVDRPCGHFVP